MQKKLISEIVIVNHDVLCYQENQHHKNYFVGNNDKKKGSKIKLWQNKL